MGKFLLLSAGCLIIASCGPVQSMTVIWEANTAIEGAEAAEAQKHAPYEYYSAQAYFEKALEEQAYADFEPAIMFGTKAAEMAREAHAKTKRAKRGAPQLPATTSAPPQPEPAAPTPAPAPVKIVPVPEQQPDPGEPAEPPSTIIVPE